MKLYHVTKRRNLVKILVEGLRPRIGGSPVGLCVSRDPDVRQRVWRRVWLTNDPSRVLCEHAGERWCSRWDPVVIEVSVDKVEEVKYYSGGTYTVSDFEYTVDAVPAENIISVCEINGLINLTA